MRRLPYQSLFDIFGTRAFGQIAAGAVIGFLMGLRSVYRYGWTRENVCYGGGIGAGIGFVSGLLLAAGDVRHRKVRAGLAKAYGCAEWIAIFIVVGGAAIFAMIWFVMR